MPDRKYIILTQEEADLIGEIKLNEVETFNPYNGKLVDGTYAVDRQATLTEYAKTGVLKKIKDKLDITQLPFRKVLPEEWDKSGWGPIP